MKILKIPTYWTVEQADSIYQFLDELKAVLWQTYGGELQDMYAETHQTQIENEQGNEFDDEFPF